MNYDHLRVMEHPVTVEDEPSAVPGLMRVYARADDGHVVNLVPHKNICNIRKITSDDEQVYDSLGILKSINLVKRLCHLIS